MGSYEIGTEADRRAGDAKLNSAAETLCRASGIFEFLSREIIPQWEKRHPDGLVHLRFTRPPELSREAASGLAQFVNSLATSFFPFFFLVAAVSDFKLLRLGRP
jgi:hypothetical protein